MLLELAILSCMACICTPTGEDAAPLGDAAGLADCAGLEDAEAAAEAGAPPP
jgi:hypothetical protein